MLLFFAANPPKSVDIPPIRTLENWDSGKNKPPEWLLTLLKRVVTIDAEQETENRCTSECTEKVDN